MNFLSSFFDVYDDGKDNAVLCPFQHKTTQGIPYQENNPSAHINITEGLFHCKSCNRGYNELQFIQTLFNINYEKARKIQLAFNTDETEFAWDQSTVLSPATKERALALGISEAVIEELKLRTPPAEFNQEKILFPVFMFGQLLDIRAYHPGGKPKIMSKTNALSGLIVPFDIWKDTPNTEPTLICAGEKDMAVARSNGFNAITLTGGERALPLYVEAFRDKAIIIAYDNDETGIAGGEALATTLSEVSSTIKVVTGFHKVCKERGEDITDFFVKYGKTKKDLAEYIKNTPLFVVTEKVKATKQLPIKTLFEASKPENINKLIKTNIQVVAISEQAFMAPSSVVLEKLGEPSGKDTLAKGTIKSWELKEDNVEKVLHLIDNNFKEADIKSNLKSCMKVMSSESACHLKILSTVTVFKAFVTDLRESTVLDNDNNKQMEYTCYTVGHKLESGKKYMATHKLVPHPYKGNQLIMIIVDIEQANDSVSNFKITDEVKAHLQLFADVSGNTAEKKVGIIARKVKGIIGFDANEQLIQTIDLAYHTVFDFNFGTFKNVRGYLDTLVVSESRVGKSSIATGLTKTYDLGTFVSLAGNSATVPGLIGGSNKTATGFQTRAGTIPQNHGGLIIFEELGKCHSNLIAELTDIRSSNEVRISRVSGSMTMPATVRMISFSNVKAKDKDIKPIAAYPHGISIVKELVTTAEDIARYDMILILGSKGAKHINPLWEPEEPFPTEAYKSRIRWIWSRTADQIDIQPYLERYIVDEANKLNAEYDSHIKLFGPEAWKKIVRLAIAIAGYTVSSDETFEKIIVKPTHVNYAVKFLLSLYNNSTFRFKEYVTRERRYSTTDDDAVALLQDIYNKSPALIQTLEQVSGATKNMLQASSGLPNEALNGILNRLTKGLFITIDSYEIQPTERFRLTMAGLNPKTYVQEVGEADDDDF